jgi:hypothetical protein
MKKDKPKKVEYFTDEMHNSIFPFQSGISSRGYGGSSPITKPLSVKRSGQNKTRIR